MYSEFIYIKMYKIIFLLISFIFLNNQIVEAKSFKSKNGFKFDVPDKYKVVERILKKLMKKQGSNNFR